MKQTDPPRPYWSSAHGAIVLGDARAALTRTLSPASVDLVVTSPPFGLVRKKGYGNADAHEYIDWFRPFAAGFKRVLRGSGSLVIDIGGAWIAGQPTRSLYNFKLLVMLCEEFGFHLAQEFYWWNPARLPTPAEWVTVRRIRVKDAVNCIWWLSPTPWPRADNRRVAQPYSASMRQLLRNGYTAKKRPSGHDISEKFRRNNGAAIPPNLIAAAHTESNTRYLRFCKAHRVTPHPARFPTDIPEFFVRMLTDPGDLVVDPFAGSCATGEVCERLHRRWMCVELREEYLRGALGRFDGHAQHRPTAARPSRGSADGGAAGPRRAQGRGVAAADSRRLVAEEGRNHYRVPRPGLLWDEVPDQPLREDGGRTGRIKRIEN
jgi:site-specific DNA-methyltransferase (cytosine-N4-specific)